MRLRALPLALICVAAASIAQAQPHGPGPGGPGHGLPPGMPPGHPPMPRMPMPTGNLKPMADDCAITAMNVFVQARRTDAMIDVGLRVHGVKGGTCRILPAAVQLTSTRNAPVARPISMRFVDGQVQRPINVAEGAGGEALTPWVGMLRASEEKQVVLRFYAEGLDQGDGVVDPVSRISMQLKNLGPRVYAGAPLNVKISLDPALKGRGQLFTGNVKSPASPRPVGPDGTVSFSSVLSKDDLAPQIEWRYDAELPPAAEFDKLSGGLTVFEYLRSGLVQDFAAALVDPSSEKKEEKKDEKKDDKGAKKDEKKDDKKADKKDEKKDDKKKDEKGDKARIEAAWDKALDVSFVAAKSNDPVVAAMGLRNLAWLASGLGAAPSRVQAPGGNVTPDVVEVPEKIASAVAKVNESFSAATGQRFMPSVGNSIFARGSIARLGEPGSRKKEADEAIKRLVARIDENKITLNVGNFFSTAPTIALAPGVKTSGAKLVGWNKQGNPTFISLGPVVTPKSSMVHRLVHGVSHVTPMVKFFAVVSLLGLVIVGIWSMIRKDKPENAEPVQA